MTAASSGTGAPAGGPGGAPRVAVVTGGAKGIGLAIAQRLHRDGAAVVIADVDVPAAEQAAAALGSRALAVRADVTSEDSVEALVDAAVQRFGGIDVMVNNAGIIQVRPLLESTADEWRRILDVNVVGVFLGTKAAARRMVEQGRGGCIVNAASGGGRKGARWLAGYCATKAAVINLTQSSALELAEHRIRVNCYSPGHIPSPLWDQIHAQWQPLTGDTRKQMLDRFLATVPWGRFGTPEDVANAVAWLVSPESEYVNGQAIAMNGAELLF